MIRKPERFGHGNYMTVAIVDPNNWLGNNEDIIDDNSIIEIIKRLNIYIRNFI